MEMKKPIKPIEPDIRDKVKYPHTKPMTDMSPKEIEDRPYIRDCKQYRKDKEKYDKELEIYEQLKMIKFIKAAKEKLILKKFKIVKIK